MPRRRLTAGGKLVMKTSARGTIRHSTACPSAVLRSRARPCLLRDSSIQAQLCSHLGLPGNRGRCRNGSPAGGSILITSAPKSARIVAAAGAAMKLAQSSTVRPSNIRCIFRNAPLPLLPLLCVTGLAALSRVQLANVATIPGRADEHLVEAHVLGPGRYEQDEIAEIFRLQHAGALLGADRHGAMLEDRSRHLARTDDAGTNAVAAFLHVDAVRRRDQRVLGGAVAGPAQHADEATGPGGGMDDETFLLGAHHRQSRGHDIEC